MKLFRIPREPKTYLDVLKLLAIVLVVFNHSGTNGFRMYTEVAQQPQHLLLMCFSAFVKIAVPLFFMASGALLLRRDEPYGRTLFRRVLRFAAILVAASAFFYWRSLGEGETFSLPDFLDGLYRNKLTGHLWYLYSYVCMLLLLPFLRRLARGMTLRDALLLAVVYQGAQLLTVADYALYQGTATHTGYLSFFVAADYVVYPLLGYFIDNHPADEEREEVFYILLFLGAAALLLTGVLMDWRMTLDGGWSSANQEVYMGRLSLLPAVAVFCGMKRLFARVRSGRAASVLFVLGSCTFGVYLFDPVWRQLTQKVRWLLAPFVGPFAATLVQTLCAVLLGLAAMLAWKCLCGGVRLLGESIMDEGRDEEKSSAV